MKLPSRRILLTSLTLSAPTLACAQFESKTAAPAAGRFEPFPTLKAANFSMEATGYMAVITGVVSPMSAAALQARRIHDSEKQLPNPLN